MTCKGAKYPGEAKNPDFDCIQNIYVLCRAAQAVRASHAMPKYYRTVSTVPACNYIIIKNRFFSYLIKFEYLSYFSLIRLSKFPNVFHNILSFLDNNISCKVPFYAN